MIFGAKASFGANWLPFGPDGGDARRIVPDPSNHSHLYLGTANGWIYESYDTGARWRRLARIDKQRDDLVLDSIVVDASNPRHLIVGAYRDTDGGLYISYDAGKTWTSQPEMKGESVRAIKASTTDPKQLVAGTLKGVFRSVDSGQHWKLISPPDSPEIHEVASVAIDPVDPNIIYVGTWHLPWKTTDGGEHWENIKNGIIDDSDVFSIIVDPQHSTTVYASACSGIYKSEDAGTLFHKIQGIPSSARRTRVLLQDPNDLQIVFAGTTEGLWRSNDAGKTWSRTTGPEIIVNDVSIDSTDSHHVLIATDRGGVLSSNDGGDTFQSSNAGFSARQITAFKRDKDQPAVVLVGIVNDKEWGGVFRSPDGGLSWQQRSEGLQGRDVFSLGQAPDGTFLAGTAHGIFRYDGTALSWVKVENAPAGAAQPDGANPLGVVVRAPVPVSRNHYPGRTAGRGTPVHHSGTSHGAIAGKHTSKATARRPMTSRPAKVVGSHHAATAKASPKHVSHGGVPHGTGPSPSGDAPPANNAAAPLPTAPVAPTAKGFDGSVSGLTTAGQTVLALTSVGLMSSDDNGLSWTLSGPERSADWRYLSSAKSNVVAASLHSVSFSADAGKTWATVLLPEGLTQIGAVAVEASGRIWVGGREGIFVSSDAGSTWTTPKNLFVNSVNSIFYDEGSQRMIITAGGYGTIVFLVQLPGLQVTFADTGWSLRFARPVGDHLLAATLFDGIVIQPRMVASPMGTNPPAAKASAPPPEPAVASPRPTLPAESQTLNPGGVPNVEPVHLPTSPQ